MGARRWGLRMLTTALAASSTSSAAAPQSHALPRCSSSRFDIAKIEPRFLANLDLGGGRLADLVGERWLGTLGAGPGTLSGFSAGALRFRLAGWAGSSSADSAGPASGISGSGPLALALAAFRLGLGPASRRLLFATSRFLAGFLATLAFWAALALALTGLAAFGLGIPGFLGFFMVLGALAGGSTASALGWAILCRLGGWRRRLMEGPGVTGSGSGDEGGVAGWEEEALRRLAGGGPAGLRRLWLDAGGGLSELLASSSESSRRLGTPRIFRF